MAFASIENADEEDKDCFYYSLQMTDDDVPRNDVLLMLGDLNARVGCNDKNRDIGKHGVGDLTNNGERVINLCEENNIRHRWHPLHAQEHPLTHLDIT